MSDRWLNPWAKYCPKGLYIHIPFCLQKCAYCDFLSFPAPADVRQKYLTALCREMRQMEQAADFMRPEGGLTSLYFGGGTPSLLEAEDIDRLCRCAAEVFGIHQDCEKTLEANPGTLDLRKLIGYREAGINRLSLGIQSFDDDCLRKLGRVHRGEEAEKALSMAWKAGFRNISADLMLGIPGQSFDTFRKDLDRLLEYDPTHLSIYSLIIEEGTPFYERYGSGAVRGAEGLGLAAASDTRGSRRNDLPEEEDEREMYHDACQRLAAAGFEHYEISNWAKPGRRSLHNSLYWRAEPYYGCGLGAASYVAGLRYQNTSDRDDYLLHGKTRAESIEIDAAEALREFFLLGLRMLDGVDLRDFERIYRRPLPDDIKQSLSSLEKRSFLLHEGSRWRLHPASIDFANEVFRAFV